MSVISRARPARCASEGSSPRRAASATRSPYTRRTVSGDFRSWRISLRGSRAGAGLAGALFTAAGRGRGRVLRAGFPPVRRQAAERARLREPPRPARENAGAIDRAAAAVGAGNRTTRRARPAYVPTRRKRPPSREIAASAATSTTRSGKRSLEGPPVFASATSARASGTRRRSGAANGPRSRVPREVARSPPRASADAARAATNGTSAGATASRSQQDEEGQGQEGRPEEARPRGSAQRRGARPDRPRGRTRAADRTVLRESFTRTLPTDDDAQCT